MLAHNNFQGALYGYQPGATRYSEAAPVQSFSNAQLHSRVAQHGDTGVMQSSYAPSLYGTRTVGAQLQSAVGTPGLAQATPGQYTAPTPGQYYFPHDSVRQLRPPPSFASMGLASGAPAGQSRPLPIPPRAAPALPPRGAEVRMEVPGRAYAAGGSQMVRALPQLPQTTPRFVSDVDVVDTDQSLVPYRAVMSQTPAQYRLMAPAPDQPLRGSQIVSDVEDYSVPAQRWGAPRHPEVPRAPIKTLFPEYNPGNMPLDFLCKSLVPLASGIQDLRAVFGPLPASHGSSRPYPTENRTPASVLGMSQPTWTDWLVESLRRDPTYVAAVEREKRSSPNSLRNSRKSSHAQPRLTYGQEPAYDGLPREQIGFDTPWTVKTEQADAPREREYQYGAPSQVALAGARGGPAEDVASVEHQFSGQRFLHNVDSDLRPPPAPAQGLFKAPDPPADPPVPPRPAPQAIAPASAEVPIPPRPAPPAIAPGSGASGAPKVGALAARLAAYQQAASEVT